MSNSKHVETVAATVRDIPLDQLVPSKVNVRRRHSSAAIKARAASILAHGLLQNLVVRSERDGEGAETGNFEVTAGRGRLAALKLLAKRGKIATDAPISCNVREDGIAEELSLAENFSREALHPADEFEAFHGLHIGKGLSAEEIAARFGTTKRHVQERLKLAAVSSALIALYRKEDMTLEQLMAFTVSDDPARQEEVWASLSWDKSPGRIRDALLESHVPVSDKRVQFVGVVAYEAEGGIVLRDLFAEDDGGYLTDPVLLDRLATEKLAHAAEVARAEGWKWVEASVNFPHGHGFARVHEREVSLSEGDAAKVAKLETKIADCESALEESDDAALETKLAKLQSQLARYDAKRFVFDPEDVARGGAFVVIGHGGEAEVVRGLLRPEDRSQANVEPSETVRENGEAPSVAEPQGSGLSDKLTADLTAHRTMALRDALAASPDTALTALVHTLVLQRFYHSTSGETCLNVAVRHTYLTSFAPDIEEGAAGRAIAAREDAWARRLPKEVGEVWEFVADLPVPERLELLAHCVAYGVDAVARSDEYCANPSADGLAEALSLDMTTYWQATAASYFSRVSKAKITEALSEAGLSEAARRIAGGKKADMATAAETLLAGKGWLPEVLRTQKQDQSMETEAPVAMAAE